MEQLHEALEETMEEVQRRMKSRAAAAAEKDDTGVEGDVEQ
jgi:hypothetical protein